MIGKYGDLIIEWLNQRGRHYNLLLKKPLSKQQIHDLSKDLPIMLTNELYELYSWHNGNVNEKGFTNDMVSFSPGFYILPLEEAINYYRKFIIDSRWDESWFPAFANGGGDFYVVKCSKNILQESEVLGFMLDYGEVEVEYLTLQSMFETIYESYKQGAYFVDKDGYLEIDLEKEALIANQKNPNLARWLDELKGGT